MTITNMTTPNVYGDNSEGSKPSIYDSQGHDYSKSDTVLPDTSLDIPYNKSGTKDSFPSINCGENFRTLVCCFCGELVKIPIDCGDRLCVSCNRRRAQRLYRKWANPLAMILKDIPPNKMKFLTLTFKSKKEIQVNKLKRDFQRLRDRKTYRKAWAGGIYDIETNYDGEFYNLHIHAVVKGDYVPQKTLSEDWFDITGDSMITDIRAVKYCDKHRYKKVLKAVLGYLMKYISKPADNDVDWSDYNEAFSGRRMIQGWGCFYNMVTVDKSPYSCFNCGHSSWEILDYLEDDHPRLIFNRPELSLDSFSDSYRPVS